MLRPLAALVMSGCALMVSGTHVGAQEGGRVTLEAAAARYGAASSVCADFVQIRSVPLLRQEVTQTGRLCSADPNLFAMRFTDPAGNVIVSDGATQWIYRPSDNPGQVFRADVGPGTRGQDFYRELLENPGAKYDVTCSSSEDIAGRRSERLCLRPKEPARDLPDVVWIDTASSVIRRIHFREENGSERTITLSDIVFDGAPPEGWFVFTPPAGAVVIPM